MFDVIIRNARIFDGGGETPYVGDVAVCAERIAAIGDLSRAEARRIIDGGGRCLCPGFVDVHSHSDAYLLIEPSAPSKVSQGVTTEIVGNCGASAAPRAGKSRMPSDWQEKSYPGEWDTVAEYRALLEEVCPAVNVALLIGHNRIRAGAIGYEARAATADEIRRMQDLLARALDEGGIGLSTGLIYTPGMFAERAELAALAKTAAERGGIYTSHMRSEGAKLLEAIDEALAIGREADIRVEISHLKTTGRRNWGLIDAALDRIRAARAGGLCVAADRYPYTAACTELDVILPDWASGGGREAVLERLRDPVERGRIREALTAEREPDYWEGVSIGSTHHPDNRDFQGRRLLDVAEALGVAPVDAALHLIETDGLRTGGIFFGMSEENMWRILAEPWVMLGSDASIRSLSGPLSLDHPHPRAYGTFPRFLRAALDGRTVPVEEAIRKMTSLPADHFRLKDRGRVAVGAYADLVLFDPSTVRDTATYEEPHSLAVGIDLVLVNGAVAWQDGAGCESRAGKCCPS